MRISSIPICATKSKPRPKNDKVPTWMAQYLPEQYIWKSFLEKNKVELKFNFYTDVNKSNVELTEKSFSNNLVIVNYKDYGIKFLKYNPYKWDCTAQYNYAQWQLLYKKYCNKDFKISFIEKLSCIPMDKKVWKYKHKIKNQFDIFITPIKLFIKWVVSPFYLFFYIIKIIIYTIVAYFKII